jgi:hypothetical protein
MRTDNSTIYENRTIYNPEDNISTCNLTKYEFNYYNEEVEFDEANGIGVRPNLLSATINQDESQNSFQKDSAVMGALRLDSSMGLAHKDSLASGTGKDSAARKSPLPNDGFESHVQQLEEASPLESKTGSKSSIGSTNNLPKSEPKTNPHRSIRDSVFRTSPRGQKMPARTHNTIQPRQAEGPEASRGLYKAKSCVIPRVPQGNEEVLDKEDSLPKTSNNLETIHTGNVVSII